MRVFEGPVRDMEMDATVAHCPRCHLGVYRYDDVAPIYGGLVHMDCMTAEEQDAYCTHPAGSFVSEAC